MLLAVDGLAVRALRLARGMTQTECCERSGISLRTLQRLEAGHYTRPSTLRAVERALDAVPRTLGRPRSRVAVNVA